MKCKVCQVETARRIRCGALVCEACKRFFMRQKRLHLNGNGIKCKSGNDQCLKAKDSVKAKPTQRGWLWRDICAACRYKKCVQIGMKYNGKQIAPKDSKSLTEMVQDFAVDGSGDIQQHFLPGFDNNWLFVFSELMKKEQQQQQQEQQQRQQECQTLINLLTKKYLCQYLVRWAKTFQ